MRLLNALIAPAAAVLLAAGCASTAAPAPSRATPSLSRAVAALRIPWSRIGPGWELVQDSTGTVYQPGPVTLDLVDPSGHRYRLYRWAAPASRTAPEVPSLLAWSADKTLALLSDPLSGRLEQLSLLSGSLTRLRLAGHAVAFGYAGTSRDILGYQLNEQKGILTRLARYSPSGRLIEVLVAGSFGGRPAYQGTGGTYATGDGAGVALLGDGLAGTGRGILRRLPVPGAGPDGCSALRWWDARTILASCLVPGPGSNRLWLVPADGARPVPLTPLRPGSTPDHGDIGAWSLSGRLYLQVLGACGTVQIFRQAPGGRLTHVTVPHTTGDYNRILTALGPRLLIQAVTDCPGSESLLWFDPRTNAEQWLIKTPPGQAGVVGAVPFPARENANR